MRKVIEMKEASIRYLLSSIRGARHLCSRMHKKGAGVALTSLCTLRHNRTVRDKPAWRKSSYAATDVCVTILDIRSAG
jgi:hypothetical protein